MPNLFSVTVGSSLKKARLKCGFSQATLGQALTPPVSFQQVQKYESGANRVSLEAYLQWCKVCRVRPSIRKLMGELV